MSVLADAEQDLERRYAMRLSGVDLDAVQKRVCALFSLKADELYGRGRQKTLVEARSLFCFWAVGELGVPQKSLAERFSLTEPAISYAVRRGQRIAQERHYKLLEKGQGGSYLLT
jgi:chromosomal replication initiation ATPase DnaA